MISALKANAPELLPTPKLTFARERLRALGHPAIMHRMETQNGVYAAEGIPTIVCSIITAITLATITRTASLDPFDCTPEVPGVTTNCVSINHTECGCISQKETC